MPMDRPNDVLAARMAKLQLLFDRAMCSLELTLPLAISSGPLDATTAVKLHDMDLGEEDLNMRTK